MAEYVRKVSYASTINKSQQYNMETPHILLILYFFYIRNARLKTPALFRSRNGRIPMKYPG